MDIIEIGTNLIKKQFGTNIDGKTIAGALDGLLDGKGGSIDIQQLVSRFMAGGGLASIVNSWLGDGDNEGISTKQVTEVFGNEKITEFAKQLGVGERSAAEGLADVVPQMIDKVSSGGSLLDEVADLGGILDMAKKLF